MNQQDAERRVHGVNCAEEGIEASPMRKHCETVAPGGLWKASLRKLQDHVLPESTTRGAL